MEHFSKLYPTIFWRVRTLGSVAVCIRCTLSSEPLSWTQVFNKPLTYNVTGLMTWTGSERRSQSRCSIWLLKRRLMTQ